MSAKIYLVTGASRGLGLGLVQRIVEQQPDAVVYAGYRSGRDLLDALSQKSSNVKPIKLTANKEEEIKAAVAQIEKEQGRLDVAIANAGVSKGNVPIAKFDVSQLEEMFQINVIGVALLLKHTQALLRKSQAGQFLLLGSAAGQFSKIKDIPLLVSLYGSTKAAANFLIARAHMENDNVTYWSVHPGLVKTDMTMQGADQTGMGEEQLDAYGAISVQTSTTALLKLIGSATKDSIGGRMTSWNNGKPEEW